MTRVDVVILAAGQGKRMKSQIPKVLHKIAGRTLLEFVVCAAKSLDPEQTHVVIGHGGDVVKATLSHLAVTWVEQTEQLGTGHAVQQATPNIPDDATVVVLYADGPLIRPVTLRSVIDAVNGQQMGLITIDVDEPSGYGRILRAEDGEVIGIVEERDANDEQRKIGEINTGILAVSASRLKGWLSEIDANNSQGEYYLTEVIALAVRDGVKVRTVCPTRAEEVLGVNDRAQLAHLERYYQREETNRLMIEGATLYDPQRVDIRGELTIGQDVVIDVNTIFEGDVTLGDRVKIGPNTLIKNSNIGADTEVYANCVIEDAAIGSSCNVGPFSRVRPETELASNVRIGNFVEIKKSRIASGSKVNHLSYVGDSELGSRVNVGAGTITCNYDGVNKHKTVVGDDSFIGSGTQLVAPVVLGNGSTIGAGSTITRDTPPDALTLARSKQQTVKGWTRPTKK